MKAFVTKCPMAVRGDRHVFEKVKERIDDWILSLQFAKLLGRDFRLYSECMYTERICEFIRTFEFVYPWRCEVLAPALFADCPRDAVSIAVESTRSMLDLVVKLSKRLDPSGKDSFRTFESLQPFQNVVVSA